MRKLAAVLCLLASPAAAQSLAAKLVALDGGSTGLFANPAATGTIPAWLSYSCTPGGNSCVRYGYDAAGALQTSPNNLDLKSALPSAVGWAAISNAAGVVAQDMGTGVEGGLAYHDWRFVGTASANGSMSITWNSTYTNIQAIMGQTYTQSVNVRLVGGTLANVGNMLLDVREKNSSGTSVKDNAAVNLATTANNLSAAVSNSGLVSQRFFSKATLSNAATAYVDPVIFFNTVLNGAVIDITLRIAAPQTELVTAAQTTPRPFMPTSGSAYFGGVANDHNPATLAALGLRSEPQRANLLVYSNDPTIANGWVADSGGVAVTYASTVGGMNWYNINDGVLAAQSHRLLAPSTISITQALTYTYSAYVKYVNAQYVQIAFSSAAFGATAYANFDVLNGTVAFSGAGTTATIVPGANGGYIISIAYTATSTVAGQNSFITMVPTGAAARSPSYTGANNQLLVGNQQVEQNAFATSPILTYGSAVTVSADNWSFTGAAKAQLASGAACIGVETKAEDNTAAAPGYLLEFNDGSTANRLRAYLNQPATSVAVAFKNQGLGPFNTTSGAGGDATLAARRAVIAWGGGSSVISYDGTSAAVAAQTSPTGMNTFLLGNSNVGGTPYYGWYSKIDLWPSCTPTQAKKYSTAGAPLQ